MAFAEDDDAIGGSSKKNAADEVQEEQKTINIGNIDSLEFSTQPRVVNGAPAILKTEQGASLNTIKVIPQKVGPATLVFEDEKGKVLKKISYNVQKDDLSFKVLSLRKLLYDIEGITIESMDGKIVLDGELIVPRDFDRILAVKEAYPEILNLVSLSKISKETIARKMQKEINDDPGGVNVQVKIMNDTFFLMGKVDSSSDRERAQTIALTYLPEAQVSAALKDILVQGTKKVALQNMIQVEDAPAPSTPRMVRTTYHFVEIGKEFLKQSFFKWTPLVQEGAGIHFGQATTGGVASSSNGSFTGVVSNLLPKLQAGANGGFARELFSSVTIGEEGESQDMVRQDQVPYIAQIVNGVPVTAYQNVGVSIKTKPNIIGDEKLRLNINFHFTALKGSGAGSTPAVTNTDFQNQIILKAGESAALGGLIANHTTKDIDKDPEGANGAGGGNPLFTLLRSKAFTNKKTQFVVFVTPKIIADAAEGTADIKGKIINNSKKKRRVIR